MVALTATLGRQVQTIGLIGFGHFLSHLYQLALPPLFIYMQPDLGASFLELGAALTIFNVATAVLQTPVGMLVDRTGARWILVLGLLLNAVAMIGIGYSQSYWPVVAWMLVAGTGNSVFHPADYAILSSSVNERRMGRAFSIHAFSGTSGFMTAPLLMIFLAELADWRTALLIVGIAGVALAGLMAALGGVLRDHARQVRRVAPRTGRVRTLMTRPILMFFLFYIASAAAGSGISAFAIVALVKLYAMQEATAGAALTLFFATIAVSVLFGGFLADRTGKHDLVLLATYAVAALCLAMIGPGFVPVWLVFVLLAVTGVMRGLVNPSRDMLVRRAAPSASIGAVFGFVTTGFNVGQGGAPLIYGWMMDNGEPAMVFWLAAVFTLLAIVIVLVSRERGLYASP